MDRNVVWNVLGPGRSHKVKEERRTTPQLNSVKTGGTCAKYREGYCHLFYTQVSTSSETTNIQVMLGQVSLIIMFYIGNNISSVIH